MRLLSSLLHLPAKEAGNDRNAQKLKVATFDNYLCSYDALFGTDRAATSRGKEPDPTTQLRSSPWKKLSSEPASVVEAHKRATYYSLLTTHYSLLTADC